MMDQGEAPTNLDGTWPKMTISSLSRSLNR